MKRLVLHIGAGKCGSSSIQSYFATHFAKARANEDGETVAYAALTQSCVLTGRDLRKAQDEAPYGYMSSVLLSEMQPDVFRRNLAKLGEQTRGVDVVLLSCEGWIQEAEMDCARLFTEAGVPVDLVVVVRPPVELMNSSWWQWGVWTGLPLEKWCKAQLSLANFHVMLSKWLALGIGSKVKAIELSQNPIRELLRFLGFEPGKLPDAEVRNAATDARLLRHLIRNKAHYGRAVHAPAIEFRLNGALELRREKPPLVIPPALARHVIESVSDSSNRILDLVREQGSVLPEAIIGKYLDADHYADADFRDFDTWLSEGNSDEFVEELIANVLRVDDARSSANGKRGPGRLRRGLRDLLGPKPD